MGLNLAVLAAAAVAALAWSDAAATFAASPGFSGRAGGQTCLACHQPAHPASNDAQAVLVGLPVSWEPGVRYGLTVRVTGGPPALPPPAPQGGFDLAASGGRFEVDRPDLLRTVGPGADEVTYQPAGTLVREWQVDWVAPGLERQPAPVRFWLAVLAANGNHVVATNTSDQGETLDASAALEAVVPPDPAATAAWLALPLSSPAAAVRAEGAAVVVEGRHADRNATRLAYSLDGSAWTARETASEWSVTFLGLAPGPHTLAFRSEGAGRTSPEQTIRFTQAGAPLPLPSAQATPSPAFPLALLALALAAAALAATTPGRRP